MSSLPVKPEITYRPAVLSDYDAVMAIGSIYGGRDYLWSLFKQLICDPDKYGVVAVAEDTVVGFYMTSTFDGGRTVLKRSGRVSSKFRGRGIFHRLEAELDRHTLIYRPRAMYDTFANTEREEHLAGQFLDRGYKEIYRKDMFNMVFKYRNLPQQVQERDYAGKPVTVGELTREDVKLLFRTEDMALRLFPAGRLLNCYMCYRLLDVNIPHLFCERGGAFFSLRDTPRSDSAPADTEGTPNDVTRALDNASVRDIAMVTFYYCYPTPVGFLYYLDPYAVKGGVSRDHFRAHLARNLEVLQHYFPKQDGKVTVTHDTHIPSEHVSGCLAEFGIVEEMADQEKTQILYERDRAAFGFHVES